MPRKASFSLAPVMRGMSLLDEWAFSGRGLLHAVNSSQCRVLLDRRKDKHKYSIRKEFWRFILFEVCPVQVKNYQTTGIAKNLVAQKGLQSHLCRHRKGRVCSLRS